jgi:hypothetical protein
MAVTKLSNSGIKTGVLKYDSMLAGNAAYDPAATWLIQRTTTSGVTSVTFSSIPSTYQHLQLRILCTDAASNSVQMRLNSDTATNYNRHRLAGDGSTVAAGGAANSTVIHIGGSQNGFSASASYLGAIICDIHDYASTTKFKTVKSFNGYDANGSGTIELASGAWRSTSAVTSITVIMPSNFSSGSTFALYGYKGV